jgi:hypothetical protein
MSVPSRIEPSEIASMRRRVTPRERRADRMNALAQ